MSLFFGKKEDVKFSYLFILDLMFFYIPPPKMPSLLGLSRLGENLKPVVNWLVNKEKVSKEKRCVATSFTN